MKHLMFLFLTIVFLVTISPNPVQASGLDELSQIRIVSSDLPSQVDWRECGTKKFSEIQSSIELQHLKAQQIFCFAKTDPVEIVSGFTVLLPTQEEQKQFDEQWNLRGEMLGDVYSWLPHSNYNLHPPRVEDLSIFRRDIFGAVISVMLLPTNSMQARVVYHKNIAGILDQQVERALSQLQAEAIFEDLSGTKSSHEPSQNEQIPPGATPPEKQNICIEEPTCIENYIGNTFLTGIRQLTKAIQQDK